VSTSTIPATIPAPGEATRKLIDSGRRCFLPNYKPRDVVLDHGRGARVWDTDGNEYIDLGAGISVSSLGHQEPELVSALVDQAHRLWHTSNIYFNEPSVRLAEELVEATFAERVFFCNSGGEANEAAIKLARKYASLHFPPDKREIVTFAGSFHGRTLATVTATAQPKYHEGFEPLPGGFRYCAFNDREALAATVSERTCAVLVEPVQGEGGVTPVDDGFLADLREVCDRHQALLMLDEIQSGLTRTGRLFAHQWEPGVVPDVMTVAKALAGGIPIGAMLVGEKAQEALQVGSHGSTFGGNPVAAAVARVALRKYRDPELQANVLRQGQRLRAFLEETGERNGLFARVRGRGLMLGAVLSEDHAGRANEIGEHCRGAGVLVLQAGPDVLRFLPPLNISDEELDAGIARLDAAFASLAERGG